VKQEKEIKVLHEQLKQKIVETTGVEGGFPEDMVDVPEI